jgi:hypothetical protein
VVFKAIPNGSVFLVKIVEKAQEIHTTQAKIK